MTARTIRVKRSTLTRLSGSTGNSYKPPKLPKIPKVTEGLRSYGVTRKGRHIVAHFYVCKIRGAWFVRDFEECGTAIGTSTTGYTDKAEAVEIARSYCEEYGPWATSPF